MHISTSYTVATSIAKGAIGVPICGLLRWSCVRGGIDINIYGGGKRRAHCVLSIARWLDYRAGNVLRSVVPAPKRWSTTSSVCGQLVALGGWEDNRARTERGIHVGCAAGDECWRKIGELVEPRDLVIAVTLWRKQVYIGGQLCHRLRYWVWLLRSQDVLACMWFSALWLLNI